MKNKEYLKKYLLHTLIITILFLLIFLFINYKEYNAYKLKFNNKINAILEKIESKYTNITKDEILDILKNNNTSKNELREYGYTLEKDSYIMELDNINTKYKVIKLLLLLTSFISLLYVFIKYWLINDKEINKIIELIENINHKNYFLEIETLSEDKLSILKEEIYKTTIMLKENAKNSLQDKISIKNLLQDISHQLKTPLTSVNILLDNIADYPSMDTETRNKFIKQIKREITNITFLVENILKLSKFEVNTIDFIKEQVNVKKLINNAIKNLSSLCDLKNIKIEVKNECKNKIYCDYKWQVEALTNILKNAIEHSNNNSKILISCEENNIYTKITIKDFGKGMDKKDISNIFKRFYKTKDSLKDSTGIGLSLAKVIIEKDNGLVEVNSIKDEGTTFIIKYYLK